MIFVDRSGAPAPAVLTDPGLPKGGVQESAAAMAQYAKKANWKKSFNFKAYGDQTVRDALAALFNNKCAYCESSYMQAADLNVEHWRPKLQIDPNPFATLEKPPKKGKRAACVKPGYYWLGAHWDNLLPSCSHCNQARIWEIEGRTLTIGKRDQFPLVAGSPRARIPNDEKKESPLLLNPCDPKDRPDEHLEFEIEHADERGAIRARTLADGTPSPRGVASIWIYALVRPVLTLERKKQLLLIEKQMATVQRSAEAVNAVQGTAAVPLMEANLKAAIKDLNDFTLPGQPYAQMARQVIGVFLKKLIEQ
jgi:hypothetical protein